MDRDKYQQAWQAQSSQTRVTIDADLLMKEIQRSQGRFRSTIFWRDFREVAVAVVLLPLWFVLGFALSLPWTWYLTVPALLWVTGFILVDRRRHPQRPSEPGEPLLHYVKESSAQVEHQIWLLRNVFWWYLLPFSISVLAFLLHVAWQSSSVWWEFVVAALFWLLFLVVVYGAIYRMNQRVVREQLEPLRQDLLELVRSLEDDTTSVASRDLSDLMSAVADRAHGCGWAENWNRLIPSWRVATAITMATLGGALGGLWFPIDELGPVSFQAVVGAVVAFEIAVGCTWLRFRKRHEPSPPGDRGPKALASSGDVQNSANRKRPLVPGAPAILVLGLLVFLSIMTVLALYRFTSESLRVRGLDDVSAFDDDDISHIDVWLRKLVDGTYPSLSIAIVRDAEIVYQGAFGFEDVDWTRPGTSLGKPDVWDASCRVVLNGSRHVGLSDNVACRPQPVHHLPVSFDLVLNEPESVIELAGRDVLRTESCNPGTLKCVEGLPRNQMPACRNDSSSAIRPARCSDCNSDAMAGFAAAHG